MKRVYGSEIRNLLPHLRRAFMDGTQGYRDQEDHVQRGDHERKHPGQYRDNLISAPEMKERTK